MSLLLAAHDKRCEDWCNGFSRAALVFFLRPCRAVPAWPCRAVPRRAHGELDSIEGLAPSSCKGLREGSSVRTCGSTRAGAVDEAHVVIVCTICDKVRTYPHHALYDKVLRNRSRG